MNHPSRGLRHLFFWLLGLSLALPLRSQTVSGGQSLYLRTLPNGLTVLVLQDTSLEIVTAAAAVRSGTLPQASRQEGMGRLVEALFFRAHPGFDHPDSLQAWMGRKGMLTETFTEPEMSAFVLHAPPAGLADALGLLAAPLLQPEFRKRDLPAATAGIAAALQQQESDPIFHVAEEMGQRLWGQDYSRKHVPGAWRNIRNAGPEELNRLHATWFVPGNTLIAIATGGEAEAAFRLADSLFAGWPAGTDPLADPGFPRFEAPVQPGGFTQVNEFCRNPGLLAAWSGPGLREHPGDVMAGVLTARMMSLRRSRLYQKTRSSGLDGSLVCAFYPSGFPAPLVLQWQGGDGMLRPGLDSLFAEMHRLTDPAFFDTEDLSAARNLLLTETAFARAQPSLWLKTLCSRWIAGGNAFVLQYDSLLDAADLVQVRTFAAERLRMQDCVAGFVTASGEGDDLDLSVLMVPPVPVLPPVVAQAQPIPGDTALRPLPRPSRSGGNGAGAYEDTPPDSPDPGQAEPDWKNLRILFQPGMKGPELRYIATLEQIGYWMQQHPDLKLYMNSYAESKGDGVTNYQLTIQRGQATVRWMAEHYGIAPSRFELRAYGEAFPEFPEIPVNLDAKNRRITFEPQPGGQP